MKVRTYRQHERVRERESRQLTSRWLCTDGADNRDKVRTEREEEGRGEERGEGREGSKRESKRNRGEVELPEVP